MKQRVLITGGAGFIGGNLARHLLEAGCEPIAVDDLSLGCASNVPPGVTLVAGDVAQPETWDQIPPVDALVHLAGASSAPMFPEDMPGCFHNNVIGFIRALEFAHAARVRRMAYASTSSVYGNITPPLREDGGLDLPNFYAVSKYCMEQIARMYSLQYGLEVVGLRFMSVYGPREDHKGRFANLVSQFIWEVEAGRAPVVYGDGSQTRDFTSVWDIAQAIRRIIEHPGSLGSAVFNVGTGRPTAINEMIVAIAELTGQPVQPEYIPNPVRSGYVLQQIASIDRIQEALGYRPRVTLREGIREILQLRQDNRRLAAA